MKMFCYLFMYTFEQVISYIYFSNKFKSKRNPPTIIISFILSFAIQFSVYLIGIPEINIFSFLVCNLIVICVIFNASIKQGIFTVLILEVFMGVTEFLTMYGAAALKIASVEDFSTSATVMLLETFVSKTLYFLIVYSAAKLFSRKSENVSDDFSLVLLVLPMNSIIILLSFTYITTHMKLDFFLQRIFIIISILTLLADIVVAFVHEKVVSTLKRNSEYQLEKQKSNINEEYYRELQEKNDLAAQLVHDIKRHLNVIQALSMQNNNEGINDYIKSVQGSSEIKTLTQFSDNKLINVIVNRYANRCITADIDFVSDIRSIDFSFINQSDLTSLLDNLLENAFEAAKVSGKKYIELFINEKNEQFVLIKTGNSSDTPPKASGNSLISTKSDKSLHGIGTKSIKRIVSKYDGDIAWNYDPLTSWFTFTVILKIKQ